MTRRKPCTHHFMLPEPAPGQPAIGRCKRCGRKREFQNSLAGSDRWRTYQKRGGAATKEKGKT